MDAYRDRIRASFELVSIVKMSEEDLHTLDAGKTIEQHVDDIFGCANVELVGWTPFMDTGTGVLMVQTEPAEASATGVTRLWVRFEFYQPFKYDDLMIRSMRCALVVASQ